MVQVFNQTLHGDNTAFAAGQAVTQIQTIAVRVEDVMGTAEAFGISEEDRANLRAVIEADGGLAGVATREWIDRLGTGAIAVGTSVTAQPAAAALMGVLGLS